MMKKVRIPKHVSMGDKVRMIIYNTAVDITNQKGGYMTIDDKKINYEGDL
ncbi:MAG: hypothetical protein GOV02_02630 [Candidatus Aenigmarchaeota archaeon]|nr:hypothetical protein [Candidatus Aenigmarchaeota archaeon]